MRFAQATRMSRRRTLLSVTAAAAVLVALAFFAFPGFFGFFAGYDASPRNAAYFSANGDGVSRALLVGVDRFLSAEDVTPAASQSANELAARLRDLSPDMAVTVPQTPPATPDALQTLVETAFADAEDGDVSLLWLCSHGVRDGGGVSLLLCDGDTESRLTPQRLERCFRAVKGQVVLVLDCCYAGAFIGKGEDAARRLYFRDSRFHVLCSSGALESGRYFTTGGGNGAFYFSGLLALGVDTRCACPADANNDGRITAREWFRYAADDVGVSTPRALPEDDRLVLFRCDPEAPLPDGPERVAIGGVLSSDDLWTGGNTLRLGFTALRPARAAYQLVPWQQGWAFDSAVFLYDTAEPYAGGRGAVTAGRKTRAVRVTAERGGYVLSQLFSEKNGALTLHASHVAAVPAVDAAGAVAEHPPTCAVRALGNEYALTLRFPRVCRVTAHVEKDGTRRELCRDALLLPDPDGAARLYFRDSIRVRLLREAEEPEEADARTPAPDPTPADGESAAKTRNDFAAGNAARDEKDGKDGKETDAVSESLRGAKLTVIFDFGGGVSVERTVTVR